jgi:GWxTD domain-containing protein
MRAILALGMMAAVLSGGAAGQPRMPAQRGADDAFLAEAVVFPGKDSTTLRIDLHLRIDCGFFVPVRDPGAGNGSVFARRGELLVELQDSLGQPFDRTIRPIAITDEVPERDLEQRAWYQTTVSLEAPPGKYQFLIEIDDRESDRKLVDRANVVDASRSSSVLGPGTSAILEADRAVEQNDRIWLQNFGGDVLFGHHAALLVSLPEGQAETVDVALAIRAEGENDETVPTVSPDTLRGLPVRTSVALEPVSEEGRIGYELRPASETGARIVIVPLPTDSLPLRRYALTLTVSDGSTRLMLERKFRTLWPQMPFSLRDVDAALESLRYIVSGETLDSLQAGDFRTRRRNLEQFWKARDQTPGTIQNEVMTQYYRRVDYARRHFGTLRQPDGFRSDRGRIYILHGKPTSTERDLDPQAGFREIWTYRHLGKRFVFVDPGKTGNYVLTATEGQ